MMTGIRTTCLLFLLKFFYIEFDRFYAIQHVCVCVCVFYPINFETINITMLFQKLRVINENETYTQ